MAENRSRTSTGWWQTAVLAAALAVSSLPSLADAEDGPADGHFAPTYQRKSSYAGFGGGHHGNFRRREFPQFNSQVNAGSFQRPYPYHLDYYRMKYGGSYAPYFGNLYGPPNYYYYGAPYFGDYSPYYGGYGGYGGFPPGGYGAGYPGAFAGGYPGGFANGDGEPCVDGPVEPVGPLAAPVEGGVVEESTPAF